METGNEAGSAPYAGDDIEKAGFTDNLGLMFDRPESLRDALSICMMQFERYAEHHVRNGSIDKADTNQRLAAMCAEVLTRSDDVGPAPGIGLDRTDIIRGQALQLANAGDGPYLPPLDVVRRAKRYEAFLLGAEQAPPEPGEAQEAKDEYRVVLRGASEPAPPPIPDGKPLYQLYREDLDFLRKLVEQGPETVENVERGITIIDNAIAERHQDLPANAEVVGIA